MAADNKRGRVISRRPTASFRSLQTPADGRVASGGKRALFSAAVLLGDEAACRQSAFCSKTRPTGRRGRTTRTKNFLWPIDARARSLCSWTRTTEMRTNRRSRSNYDFEWLLLQHPPFLLTSHCHYFCCFDGISVNNRRFSAPFHAAGRQIRSFSWSERRGACLAAVRRRPHELLAYSSTIMPPAVRWPSALSPAARNDENLRRQAPIPI